VPISLSTLADQVGGLHGGADAFVQAPRGLRAERRAIAWGRHHGPRPGQRQDRHRPNMGLCARRQALRRAGAAGGSVLLLARSRRRASPGASCQLYWNLPGRRLQRLCCAQIYVAAPAEIPWRRRYQCPCRT
jgi:hypothetical protein